MRLHHAAWLMLLAVAGAASCEEDAYDCSQAGQAALYERRIAPLLDEDRPKSCNQCHLSGLDLGTFVKDTPCNTMACMVLQGMVDLDEPEQSSILGWIDRAAPESSGITEQVLAEEREGMLEWIRSTAYCGECQVEDIVDPCGEGPAPKCDITEHDESTFDPVDPGGCSPAVMEQLFASHVYPYRKRCFPCHFEGVTAIPAPRWINDSDCSTGIATTLNNLLALDVIDVDDPDQSILLLKPLDEAIGGVQHGGGGKFHDFEDEGYVAIRKWVTRYAECQTQ